MPFKTVAPPTTNPTSSQDPYEDPLGIDLQGAYDELKARGADETTIRHELWKLKAGRATIKAQAQEAQLQGKSFIPERRGFSKINDPTNPLKTGAEIALDVLDTPGRVGREFLSAHIAGRDSELGRAAIPKFIADEFDLNPQNRGGVQEFHNQVDTGKGLVARGYRELGNAVSDYAVPDLISAPKSIRENIQKANPYAPRDTAVNSIADSVGGAAGRFAQVLAADPSVLLSGVGGGLKRAVTQIESAAARGGVKLAPQVLNDIEKAFELYQASPELVPRVRQLFAGGGGDLRHLDAVAGANLERLGEGSMQVGVPFAADKIGVNPVEAATQAIAKLTGGKVSLPSNPLAVASEALTRSVLPKVGLGLNLPKHERDFVQAGRAEAKNVAAAQTSKATEDLRTLTQQHTTLSPTQRTDVAALGNQVPAQPLSAAEQAFQEGLGAFQQQHRLPNLPAGDPFETLPAFIQKTKSQEAIDAYESYVRLHMPNAPQEAIDAAKMIFKHNENASTWYDKLLSVFKRTKLYGNPAWASLNAVEEANKMIVSGMKDPRVLFKAYKTINGVPPNMTLLTPAGRQISAGELERIFEQVGANELHFGASAGLNPNFTSKASDVVATIGTAGVNKLIEPVEKFRSTLFKRAFIIDQLEKGNSVRAAGNNLRKVIFDINLQPLNKTWAKVQRNVQRAVPFSGYTIRSATTVPQLALKNPGFANLPTQVGRALQSQDSRGYLPPERFRNSAAYSNLPEGARTAVANAIFPDKLDNALTLTLQQRGTVFDPAGAVGEYFDPSSYSQLSPIATVPASLAYNLDEFGRPQPNLEGTPLSQRLGRAVAGAVTSGPVQLGVNAIGHHVFDTDESLIGLHKQYRDPVRDTQDEILGSLNMLPSPGWRLGITSPLDETAQLAESDEGRAVVARVAQAKSNLRAKAERTKNSKKRAIAK